MSMVNMPNDPLFPALTIAPIRRRLLEAENNYAKLQTFVLKPKNPRHKYRMPSYWTFPKDFYRLLTWEQIARLEHNEIVKREMYTVAHSSAPPLVFLYYYYGRIPEIVDVDGVIRKLHFIRFLRNLLSDEQSTFEMCNDYFSMIPILCDEMQRRNEIVFRYGGGFRPKWRGARLTPLLPSCRSIHAMEQRFLPVMYPVFFTYWACDIRASIRRKVKDALAMYNSDGEKRKALESRIREMAVSNAAWVKARQALPAKPILRAALPPAMSHLNDFLGEMTSWWQQLTVHSLYNELVEWPPYTGYALRFGQATHPLEATYAKDGIVRLGSGAEGSPLRIAPSKYSVPAPALAYVETAVTGNVARLTLPGYDADEAISHPTSGCTTPSNMSTATTGPRNLIRNWNVHPKHDEFEHRIESTRPVTEQEAHRKGQREMTNRFKLEIEHRIKKLNDLPDSLADQPEFLACLLEQPRLAQKDAKRKMAVAHRVPFMKRTYEQLEKLLEKNELSKSDKLEARVLLYSYLRQTQSTGALGKQKAGTGNATDVLLGKLSLNDSWQRLLLTGCLTNDALNVLPLLLNAEHNCHADEALSTAALVTRCDKQHVVGSSTFFGTQRRLRLVIWVYGLAIIVMLGLLLRALF